MTLEVVTMGDRTREITVKELRRIDGQPLEKFAAAESNAAKADDTDLGQRVATCEGRLHVIEQALFSTVNDDATP